MTSGAPWSGLQFSLVSFCFETQSHLAHFVVVALVVASVDLPVTCGRVTSPVSEFHLHITQNNKF